jgi:hypothetical protein
MSWDTGLQAGAARPADDGLSPQDVILNYFDYDPNPQSSNGAVAGDFGVPPVYGIEPPPNFRPRAENIQPQQARAAQEQPSRRPEWRDPSSEPAQYSGLPAFPVPAEISAPPKAAAPAVQESSRLLGAAAIGLMGGIAIAASLAAFLIYGPHPASVDIPGVGNLRLDKDEQGGYGAGALDEGAKEALRSLAASAPAEFSSEIVTADANAVPGQPAPLNVSVKSPQPLEKTLVNITGIPGGGRLNAGVDTGGGNWLLPPRRLNGLTVNLPASVTGPVTIEAQLLDSNARTPLSPKSKFVINTPAADAAAPAASQAAEAPAEPAKHAQPQSAAFNTQTVPHPSPADMGFKTQTVTAAPAQPAGTQMQAALSPSGQDAAARKAGARPEAEDLIREGNKRMRDGDILAARQYYERAVALGDPEAALAMGRSYDPIYFARIDKKNAEPDPAKAFEWYKRAIDAGAAQAALVRIDNLKHFLNM